MSDTEQKEDAGQDVDLTGATAYAAFSGDDRWYILKDGETVRYKRADGAFAPEVDSAGRRVVILTASTLRRAVETWREVPIDG